MTVYRVIAHIERADDDAQEYKTLCEDVTLSEHPDATQAKEALAANVLEWWNMAKLIIAARALLANLEDTDLDKHELGWPCQDCTDLKQALAVYDAWQPPGGMRR